MKLVYKQTRGVLSITDGLAENPLPTVSLSQSLTLADLLPPGAPQSPCRYQPVENQDFCPLTNIKSNDAREIVRQSDITGSLEKTCTGHCEPIHRLVSRQPNLGFESPERLATLYRQCDFLSIINGPDNPWRTLIWPLAQNSPPLYHAVLHRIC